MAEWPIVHISETDLKPWPEDALAYLPCSDIQEFAKGLQIYGPGDAAAGLYLIIDGRIKLSRVSESGVAVVVDIYHTDDFFGESALLNSPHEEEQAVALEPTKVMTWSAVEVERLIGLEPRLAVALMQVVVRRCLDFKNRLESFSLEGTTNRLARSLVHFAERMGRAPEGDAVTIAPITHEVLAQYVGTSREIISHHMSEFRNQGYIRYSRQGITIQPAQLRAWLLTKAKHA